MTGNLLFDKKIANLRGKFVAQLNEIFTKLEGLISLLNTQSEDIVKKHAIEEIYDLAHKIAGNAGTFGLKNIAKLTNTLQQSCVEILNRCDPLKPEDIHRLSDLFNLIAADNVIETQGKLIMEPIWEGYLDLSKKVATPAKTIIMVDSNKEFLRTMASQLMNFGFHLIPLQDHNLLRATLQTHPPVAVIINVVFPGDMDAGVNIIKELRSDNLLHFPILFLSTRDDLAARLNAVSAGSAAFFHKPIEINYFVETLKKLTQNQVKDDYRVVLIDNDKLSTKITSDCLTQAGIVTKIVNDPLQAMASIRVLNPDVIIMDFKIKPYDGIELTRAIRQHESFLLTPIIILTNSLLQNDCLAAMDAGADDFIHKSVTDKELTANVVSRANRSRELKELNRKLSINESRFRSVAQSARDTIVTTDQDGRIITWNRSAAELFGYTEASIQGCHLMNLFKERAFNWSKDGFEVVELLGERFDGSVFPAEISKSNWRVENDWYFTYIIRDIHQRKQQEKSLKKAIAFAERASEAKSEFLSSMSHELRTPLNSILGFSQLLDMNAKEPLTKNQQESVFNIKNGGRYLLDLINDILDLAQIESGKVKLSMTRVNVETLINECLSCTTKHAESRSINIKNIGCIDHFVYSDHIRLKQALLNLLSNAIKYGRLGGEVKISAEEISESLLRISVSDNGMGILENRKHEIFQPFSRLGAETSDIEGTGIGLSVTKKLMKILQGHIGFESKENVGSKFWLDIPLYDVTENIDSDSKNSNLGYRKPVHKYILYVEDDRANQILIERIVANLDNLKLITANDAESGIELAKQYQPEFIIMDINLPGMNGLQALKVLNNLEETANIPIIAMSAAAMPQNIEEGLNAGFVSYITKPIEIKDVIKVIESLLQES